MSQILRTWTFWIHAAIEDECRSDVDQMILSRMRRWGYMVEREMLTEKKPAATSTATAARTVPSLEENRCLKS